MDRNADEVKRGSVGLVISYTVGNNDHRLAWSSLGSAFLVSVRFLSGFIGDRTLHALYGLAGAVPRSDSQRD